jgi:1-deoxyxylulose-5-phosphate synthase
MTFGFQSDEATSIAILDAAAAGGVTFIDTADMYPIGGPDETRGASEEIVGRWLKGRRQDFVVTTKCGGPMSARPLDRGASRKHILDSIDASLRRLQTDYVDLYQIHFFDPATPLDETMRALEDVVTSGRARYLGCSNFLAYQVLRANHAAERYGGARFLSVQPRYNLLAREIEREMLPMCREEGLAVMSYNPLAGGLLTGKHRRETGPTEGSRFTMGRAGKLYQDRYWHEGMFDTVEHIEGFAREIEMPPAQLAIAWVMANAAVTVPILGASKPEQLGDALAAAAYPLSVDAQRKLDDMTIQYV